MNKIIVIDANVFVRYFLNDHPILSKKAKEIFLQAQKLQTKIYFDEIIVAEIIWLLTSFYKMEKTTILSGLSKLISQDWVINPRKNLLLTALELYGQENLAYIDCWLYIVGKNSGFKKVV
ncbi:PIN domain-containing protein [Candidatus Gottesmanbacteria bacterium]|nr:PIN domain-containing protein [Candidatus Gottesmanbacteria bacterium]